MNSLTLCDGYKLGHRDQYPEGTELVYSNFTPRSSRNGKTHIINFGTQIFIKKYLIEDFNKNFFGRPKEEVVQEYHAEMSAYLNDHNFKVKHVAELHDLGYLPIKIKALPEGALVPLRVPLFTIKNTKKKFFWITNYIETIASNIVWGPITSATTAFILKQILMKYATETVGDTSFVQWQAHDFSFRGMFGLEAALLSGAAHLTSFTGTDTIPAIPFLRKYYNATGLIGGSVNATEHSVMCAGGETDEKATFIRLLTKVYPKGILSVVSDTWDYYGVLTTILPQIKDIIMKREGKLVIRPDSGDQIKIICGDPNAPENSPERKGTIELLWDSFGGTVTPKGYKLLDSHIGCILGDGVTPKIMEAILKLLKEKGFASYNMVFGIGSYTYQNVTRDVYGMAMKATFCVINGEEKEIYKLPKTDKGFIKKSAKGLLQVYIGEDGDYALRDQVGWAEEENSELKTVFEDGKLIKEISLNEIREKINQSLTKEISGI